MFIKITNHNLDLPDNKILMKSLNCSVCEYRYDDLSHLCQCYKKHLCEL